MAFTETEISRVLELLEVPAGSVVYRIDELGLNATEFMALTDPQTAASAIRATLAALSPEITIDVQATIAAYEVIRLPSAGIGVMNGTVAGVQGATVDFNAAKAEFARLIKFQVPFWSSWSLMRGRGPQEARNCRVIM